MILCVIPARGGSKGLTKKNIRPLLGKPLIGYTIEAAKNENIFDRIVVSTEDHEIKAVANTFGVEVVDRPIKMAQDNSNIDEALQHAVTNIESDGNKCRIVVWLKANVPIRKKGHIKAVINKLIDSDADSVITIKKAELPVEMACKLKGDQLIPAISQEMIFPCRQQYQQSYFHSGAIYAIRRSILMDLKNKHLKPDYFLGENIHGYLINDFRYNFEIDDKKDAILCEYFLKDIQVNEDTVIK